MQESRLQKQIQLEKEIENQKSQQEKALNII
jgi:hypothetical protein